MNTRTRKHNYRTIPNLQKASTRLAQIIDHYMDVTETNGDFRRHVDYELLHKAKTHLQQIGKMNMNS